jgi:ankyrin repeat protein
MNRYTIIAAILYCGLQSISMHAMFMQDLHSERGYFLRQNRSNPLHNAARENNIERAQEALGNYYINDRDQRSETALHIAAAHGHSDIVKLLIGNNADPDVSAVGKNTPLHRALINNQENVALFLIEEAKAKIDIQNHNDETALHIATKQNLSHVVKSLITQGAILDREGTFSGTPLHIAVEKNLPDIINLIIYAGVNINHSNPFTATPLHIAASNQNIDLVKLLIQHGADARAIDIVGTSVLHIAAEKGHIDIVNFLIENGANTNATNTQGNRPLHEAAYARNTTSAQQLIQAGSADLNIENKNGKTPYTIAHDNNDQDMMLLIKKTKEANQLVEQRLAQGDRPASIIADLAQPTVVFEHANNEQQAELLQQYPRVLYAYLNAQNTLKEFIIHNKIAKAWLFYAIQYEHDDICTLLLKNKTICKNIDAIQDQFGNRSLHLTALYNQPQAYKKLLHSNASIHVKNKKNQTQYNVAKQYNRKKIIQLIARYRAVERALQQDQTISARKLPLEMIEKIACQTTALSDL